MKTHSVTLNIINVPIMIDLVETVHEVLETADRRGQIASNDITMAKLRVAIEKVASRSADADDINY